jgi:DNA-binding CsgD family transcriptional regulator
VVPEPARRLPGGTDALEEGSSTDPAVETIPPAARRPTPREREILALLATGATDNEIADILALSPATVQTHVRNAKTKLGARTRAQAVALAITHGMIVPR